MFIAIAQISLEFAHSYSQAGKIVSKNIDAHNKFHELYCSLLTELDYCHRTHTHIKWYQR